VYVCNHGSYSNGTKQTIASLSKNLPKGPSSEWTAWQLFWHTQTWGQSTPSVTAHKSCSRTSSLVTGSTKALKGPKRDMSRLAVLVCIMVSEWGSPIENSRPLVVCNLRYSMHLQKGKPTRLSWQFGEGGLNCYHELRNRTELAKWMLARDGRDRLLYKSSRPH
jgi:hypothetical protein